MTSSASFQFHKGAIRTPLTDHIIEIGRLFQFHKGAIRTGEVLVVLPYPAVISIP